MSIELAFEVLAVVSSETREAAIDRALELVSDSDLECELPLPTEAVTERMDGAIACRPPNADNDKPLEVEKEAVEGEVRGLALMSSISLEPSACCWPASKSAKFAGSRRRSNLST